MGSTSLFVPEVVQTSQMDCGPACLNSLLEGFDIRTSYDRLREACQTDLDGTSIDTIEEVANELGLDAEQVMVPVDHLFLPETRICPALVVVRLPNSFTHFVIVWRKHGNVLQVMDPTSGRQWSRVTSFLDHVYVHSQAAPAADWRDWAGSEECVRALARRARQLGLPRQTISDLLDTATRDSGWRSLGALDAAIRMMTPMTHAGGLGDGRTSARILRQYVERAVSGTETPFQVIPPAYWSVLPARGHGEDEQELVFRGAVALRVRGRRQQTTVRGDDQRMDTESAHHEMRETLAPAPSALTQLLTFMRADGLFMPATLLAGLAISACGVLVQALMYRTFLDLAASLGLSQQREAALFLMLAFVTAVLVLDLAIGDGFLRLGRHLEIRLRAHLLYKIPRLGDRYFASRLISDLAERSHAIHGIRAVPSTAGHLAAAFFSLVLTTAGIVWLDHRTIVPAVLSALVAVAMPLAIQPVITEQDMRLKTHGGALCRFYFDALRGLMPARAHGAGNAIRREHESLLVSWVQAAMDMQRFSVALAAVSGSITFGVTVWLLMTHFLSKGDSGIGLLLVYWALSIPAIGQQIAQSVLQYPSQRNLSMRLLEPLGAPEEEQPGEQPLPLSNSPSRPSERSKHRGVSIAFDGVTVRAMGHTILEKFDLNIASGSHVCIIGPSGAGKSTLVSLLLGWHRPATGQVVVDGKRVDGATIECLRRHTAWVDPNIQIWNRSLVENVRYGATPDDSLAQTGDTMDDADLISLIQKLPQGMQTRLGESGALVSGGEGQRVRLGRAMRRRQARLVILDEPFGSLDRERRCEYLHRVKEIWRGATLLCITHDVGDSRHFERVLVVEQGRIQEDGAPADLLRKPDSRYRQLLGAEDSVRNQIWSNAKWRKIRLQDGKFIERVTRRGDATQSDVGLEADMLAGDAVGRGSGRLKSQIRPSSDIG